MKSQETSHNTGAEHQRGMSRGSADATTLNGGADGHEGATITHPKDVEQVDINKLDDSKPPLVTLRTFIMCVSTSIGGFIFGFDTGQISGFLEMQVFLQRFGEQDSSGKYSFSNVRSGLIVAMLSIGTLIGALVAAPLSDKFGRRKCIPWWSLVFAIGVTIQIAVDSGQWVGIVIGRMVAGLGVGAMSVLVPLYMGESTPKQVRGAVVCCYQLFITIGILVADCINFGTEARSDTGSYRIPMAIGYIWALLLAIGVFLLPESPRWDIKHANHDKALSTMTKLYGVRRSHRAVAVEIKEINEALNASEGNHPWYEVLTGPRMMYRTILGMGLQCLQQLTGANYFFYYGTSIFSGVGIENSYITAIILGAVNVGSTFLGLYMVEKFGRRKCLTTGALFQTMTFVVFASLGHFKFQPAQTMKDTAAEKTYGTVMIVFACLFIVSFASTWGPMAWATISEMFPYRYRASAMALATASNWAFNFLLAFFTPFIVPDIDYAFGYVFAGCNLAAAAVVYFFLMESSGKTLEEVDTMYLLHVSPRKSSKWTKEMVGAAAIAKDERHLGSGGRNIVKRESDADKEEVEQVEAGEGSVGRTNQRSVDTSGTM